MDEILEALQQPVIGSMNWSETIGDAAGLACVWLVARKHILNWPVGLLNNAFWFLTFWWSKLYGDATLQLVFAALGVYGWLEWTRKDQARKELPVRRTTGLEWSILAPATLAATVAIWALLSRKTDSPVPVWDASVVSLSLAATYGQAKKLLESWWLWIAVDVLSVPLYVVRGLYPTAMVYLFFLLLCVFGLISWTNELRERALPPRQARGVAEKPVAS